MHPLLAGRYCENNTFLAWEPRASQRHHSASTAFSRSGVKVRAAACTRVRVRELKGRMSTLLKNQCGSGNLSLYDISYQAFGFRRIQYDPWLLTVVVMKRQLCQWNCCDTCAFRELWAWEQSEPKLQVFNKFENRKNKISPFGWEKENFSNQQAIIS